MERRAPEAPIEARGAVVEYVVCEVQGKMVLGAEKLLVPVCIVVAY